MPVAVKRRVFLAYRVKYVPRGYEVDHLISLELGGSNSVTNLWPESYKIQWNARVKDALEDRLHMMVCNGSITMAEAQQEISQDWIETYKRVFNTDLPQRKKKESAKRRRKVRT